MEERSIGYRRFESNYDVDQSQIEVWVEQFHKKGFLFLPQVLTNDHCQQLRSDLEWSLENNPNGLNSGDTSSSMHLCHRMFEHSQANNLNLFDLEPIISLVSPKLSLKPIAMLFTITRLSDGLVAESQVGIKMMGYIIKC